MKKNHHIGRFVSLLAAILLGGCSGQQTKANPAECIVPVDGGTIEQVTDLKVGEIVTFGTYEQDDDPENGPEKIEWIVIDVEEHRALLLSRYLLDAIPYNESQKYLPWKDCTLRKWLNKEFYKTAFTEAERSLIPKTRLKNEEFVYFIKSRNVDTTDRVFLLGNEDIGKYYGDWMHQMEDGEYHGSCPDLIAEPTPYAKSRGVKTVLLDEEYYDKNLKEKNYGTDVIGLEGARWWYRRNGDGWKTVDIVTFLGSVGGGIYVSAEEVGVRPAIYVTW